MYQPFNLEVELLAEDSLQGCFSAGDVCSLAGIHKQMQKVQAF